MEAAINGPPLVEWSALNCGKCDRTEQYMGLVINYVGGGLQNGKIANPKLVAPTRQDRAKLMPPF